LDQSNDAGEAATLPARPGTGPAALKRTIAAILAADVAGYSRLVAEDEEDALRRLGDHAAVFRGHVSAHGGRVFNTAGDAILAEFPSAVDALRAAIAIQEALRLRNADYAPARRVEFRMGITIGDVVERDGDLLGDGVNIAARLEGLAEPGGICVSRSVHEAVANKVPAVFRDIGRQRLKNIPQPVHVLRVMIGASDAAKATTLRGRLVQLAAVAALVLVCGAVAWLAFTRPAWLRVDGPVAAGEADRTTLTVAVARAARRCFPDETRIGGTLAPREIVEVRPETEGLRVQRVLAEPPAEVAAGQVLAELAADGQPGQVVPVRAPVAGTIGRAAAHVGAPASPRAPALFQIVSRGELELAADVPAAVLPRLAAGQAVSVTPLGVPAVTGRIRHVSSSVDNATQLGQARVLLEPDARLRWGTFARGTVALGERCGLGVPFSALSRGPDGTAVYVVNNNRVEARPVTTGLSAGEDVEVRGGIAPGDLIVQRAGPFLREGDVIRPVVAGGQAG
jgi:class 3 adenylate cyclase/multidrug efflux pump subunit AcrA (membrane-fusion protein)